MNQHAVQFFHRDEVLFDAVADFLATGLERGAPAVVIATQSHRHGFLERLKDRGVPGMANIAMLDARQTLEQFMVAGAPDWGRFKNTVGRVLEESHRKGDGAQIRAYGEMVDVLWRDGNHDAALRLEEMWNDLAKVHSFSLLCAYSMGSFSRSSDRTAFDEVCAVHSHVHRSEEVEALHDEIAHRRSVEDALKAAIRLRDDFLAVAGHELRSPLTALQLQITSLKALIDKGETERARARLERAAVQVTRMANLIDEMLDVSRLSAGRFTLNKEECDLAVVVRDVVERASDTIARNETQVRIIADAPVPGTWDRMRIDQVAGNLLSNALKYGRRRPVEIVAGQIGDRARLVVRDQGIGISPEDQQRIFERFERAEPARNLGGLGLGLWIVRQVVEAHGGAIRVESEPDRGSTFTVDLPVS